MHPALKNVSGKMTELGIGALTHAMRLSLYADRTILDLVRESSDIASRPDSRQTDWLRHWNAVGGQLTAICVRRNEAQFRRMLVNHTHFKMIDVVTVAPRERERAAQGCDVDQRRGCRQ